MMTTASSAVSYSASGKACCIMDSFNNGYLETDHVSDSSVSSSVSDNDAFSVDTSTYIDVLPEKTEIKRSSEFNKKTGRIQNTNFLRQKSYVELREKNDEAVEVNSPKDSSRSKSWIRRVLKGSQSRGRDELGNRGNKLADEMNDEEEDLKSMIDEIEEVDSMNDEEEEMVSPKDGSRSKSWIRRVLKGSQSRGRDELGNRGNKRADEMNDEEEDLKSMIDEIEEVNSMNDEEEEMISPKNGSRSKSWIGGALKRRGRNRSQSRDELNTGGSKMNGIIDKTEEVNNMNEVISPKDGSSSGSKIGGTFRRIARNRSQRREEQSDESVDEDTSNTTDITTDMTLSIVTDIAPSKVTMTNTDTSKGRCETIISSSESSPYKRYDQDSITDTSQPKFTSSNCSIVSILHNSRTKTTVEQAESPKAREVPVCLGRESRSRFKDDSSSRHWVGSVIRNRSRSRDELSRRRSGTAKKVIGTNRDMRYMYQKRNDSLLYRNNDNAISVSQPKMASTNVTVMPIAANSRAYMSRVITLATQSPVNRQPLLSRKVVPMEMIRTNSKMSLKPVTFDARGKDQFQPQIRPYTTVSHDSSKENANNANKKTDVTSKIKDLSSNDLPRNNSGKMKTKKAINLRLSKLKTSGLLNMVRSKSNGKRKIISTGSTDIEIEGNEATSLSENRISEAGLSTLNTNSTVKMEKTIEPRSSLLKSRRRFSKVTSNVNEEIIMSTSSINEQLKGSELKYSDEDIIHEAMRKTHLLFSSIRKSSNNEEHSICMGLVDTQREDSGVMSSSEDKISNDMRRRLMDLWTENKSNEIYGCTELTCSVIKSKPNEMMDIEAVYTSNSADTEKTKNEMLSDIEAPETKKAELAHIITGHNETGEGEVRVVEILVGIDTIEIKK